jgi:hypothetical protein
MRQRFCFGTTRPTRALPMLRGKVRCLQIQDDHGELPAVGIDAAVYLPGIGTPSWRLDDDTTNDTQPLGRANTDIRVPHVYGGAQMGQLN